jgi:hypothetical protein
MQEKTKNLDIGGFFGGAEDNKQGEKVPVKQE